MTTYDAALAELTTALPAMDRVRLERWGRLLASSLTTGGRVMVAGNGGSAAQAQHFVAELVGRFAGERVPLPALSLAADPVTLTALGNDYGFDEVFARQVAAHGRPGDFLVVLTTSGLSANVLRAVAEARDRGIRTLALTGAAPNPVADLADDVVAIATTRTSTVQECHQVAVHAICAALDDEVRRLPAGEPGAPDRVPGTARAVRLAVVGDVLLDVDLDGTTNRVSPEAPVPVLAAPSRTASPGGAGLAALMAAADGHEVTLVTALAEDAEAAEATSALTAAGVRVVNVGTSSPTAVKTRLRARGQTLLMLDHTPSAGPPGALPPDGAAAIRDADAVLVADYGRGVAAAVDTRAVLAELNGRIPVVWDPHPRGPVPVPGVSLVTPSTQELGHPADRPAHTDLAEDVARARELRREWEVGHVVVTRGSSGAVLIADDTAPALVVPTTDVRGDTCGAGDRFAVTAAVQLGRGALPSQAVAVAVRAASAHVGRTAHRAAPKAGTRRSEVGETATDGVALARRVRDEGGVVVATCGCFDLLHSGHVAMLAQARALGDCLVVLLNSDSSVRRLKGPGRPLVAEADRAGVLRALSAVDHVVVFDEDTPSAALDSVRPHIFVKGGDYALDELPERAVVERHGGQVVLVPYLDGRSTTALIDRAGGTAGPVADRESGLRRGGGRS